MQLCLRFMQGALSRLSTSLSSHEGPGPREARRRAFSPRTCPAAPRWGPWCPFSGCNLRGQRGWCPTHSHTGDSLATSRTQGPSLQRPSVLPPSCADGPQGLQWAGPTLCGRTQTGPLRPRLAHQPSTHPGVKLPAQPRSRCSGLRAAGRQAAPLCPGGQERAVARASPCCLALSSEPSGKGTGGWGQEGLLNRDLPQRPQTWLGFRVSSFSHG